MNPLRLVRLIRDAGRIAEPAPPAPTAAPAPAGPAIGTGRSLPVADDNPDRTPQCPRALRGSVHVRHVDVGSCNGCEIEVGQAFGPVYDVDRYGVHLVASPRHADVLAVTGVVTHNMRAPLERTLDATPRPRMVVAIGDCACDGGEFVGAYGVVGAVGDVVPVDLQVPGCPPTPDEIVAALRRVSGR